MERNSDFMTELKDFIKSIDEKIEDIKDDLRGDLEYIFKDLQKERTLLQEIYYKTKDLIFRYNRGLCPYCGSTSVYSNTTSSRNPYMKDNYCGNCDAKFPLRMMAAIFMDELSKLYGVR